MRWKRVTWVYRCGEEWAWRRWMGGVDILRGLNLRKLFDELSMLFTLSLFLAFLIRLPHSPTIPLTPQSLNPHYDPRTHTFHPLPPSFLLPPNPIQPSSPHPSLPRPIKPPNRLSPRQHIPRRNHKHRLRMGIQAIEARCAFDPCYPRSTTSVIAVVIAVILILVRRE